MLFPQEDKGAKKTWQEHTERMCCTADCKHKHYGPDGTRDMRQGRWAEAGRQAQARSERAPWPCKGDLTSFYKQLENIWKTLENFKDASHMIRFGFCKSHCSGNSKALPIQ